MLLTIPPFAMDYGIVFAAHLLFMYSIVFVANYLRISVNVVGRHLFSLTQSSEGTTTLDDIRTALQYYGYFGFLNGSSDVPTRKFEEPGLLELTPHIRDKCLGSSEHFLLTGLPILADIVSQACVGTLEKCVVSPSFPSLALLLPLFPCLSEAIMLSKQRSSQ